METVKKTGKKPPRKNALHETEAVPVPERPQKEPEEVVRKIKPDPIPAEEPPLLPAMTYREKNTLNLFDVAEEGKGIVYRVKDTKDGQVRTEVLIGKDPLDRYLSCGHTMDDAMPSVFHIDEIELVDVNVRGDWSEETVTQGTKPETSVTTEDPTPNYYNKIWNGKIDPYRICRLFDVGGGPREQIVKKGLRGTSKGQTEADLIKELKKAMDRWVEMAIEDGILTGDEPWI